MPGWGALPTLRTPLTPDQVVERLAGASKRGRLAGFSRSVGLFSCALFGKPFDRRLVARAQKLPDGTAIRFEAKLLPKLPLIFVVTIVITIYPGVRFMDLLIPSSWGWIPTWTWYLPLTVLPLPWMVRSMWRKSEAEAWDHAQEVLEKLAKELDGTYDAGA